MKIYNSYLVSSRTDAFDEVDDILEADGFDVPTGAVLDLDPYTDLAFLADSPATSELLLPRTASDFRVTNLLFVICFGDVCTALADFSKPTEDDDEILRSLASDLHSMSSV